MCDCILIYGVEFVVLTVRKPNETWPECFLLAVKLVVNALVQQ